MSDETIVFETEDGEEVELVVIDETQFNGTSYILVAEALPEETDEETETDETVDVMILKSVGSDGEGEESFETVEDDTELEAVSKIFKELLEQDDIQLEV